MGDFRFVFSENTETVFINDTAVNFPEHSHSDNFVVSAVISGQVFVRRGGNTTGFTAGQAFVICPYSAHSVYSDIPVDMVSFCINKNTVYENEKDFFEKIIISDLHETGLPEKIRENFFENAVKIYTDNHAVFHKKDDWVKQGIDDIEKYPEDEKTLENFADEVYISKYHYLRKFKELAGLPPNKFRLVRRVRMSQRLLRQGESIADTAAFAGFYDQSHFDRYFKKTVGISPSEYVRSVSNFLQA